MSERINITKIHQYGCMPTQWNCETDDGRQVYVRYRHGELSCSISNEPTSNPDDAVREETSRKIYSKVVGDSGWMQTYEMLQHLSGVLWFLPVCEVVSDWKD